MVSYFKTCDSVLADLKHLGPEYGATDEAEVGSPAASPTPVAPPAASTSATASSPLGAGAPPLQLSSAALSDPRVWLTALLGVLLLSWLQLYRVSAELAELKAAHVPGVVGDGQIGSCGAMYGGDPCTDEDSWRLVQQSRALLDRAMATRQT